MASSAAASQRIVKTPEITEGAMLSGAVRGSPKNVRDPTSVREPRRRRTGCRRRRRGWSPGLAKGGLRRGVVRSCRPARSPAGAYKIVRVRAGRAGGVPPALFAFPSRESLTLHPIHLGSAGQRSAAAAGAIARSARAPILVKSNLARLAPEGSLTGGSWAALSAKRAGISARGNSVAPVVRGAGRRPEVLRLLVGVEVGDAVAWWRAREMQVPFATTSASVLGGEDRRRSRQVLAAICAALTLTTL